MTPTAIGRTLILTTVAACVAGCGGDTSKPKLGRVSGKVTYNGQPVTKGIVSFVPRGGAGAQTGQSATGELGSDGSYTLTTFDNGDGAVLGEHTVLVIAREEDAAIKGHGMPIPDSKGQINIKAAKSLVPEKYATAGNSPLRYTVNEGSQLHDIELTD
jgi:hypothetical protein